MTRFPGDSSSVREDSGEAHGEWSFCKRRRGIGVAIHTCRRASTRCCHALPHLRADDNCTCVASAPLDGQLRQPSAMATVAGSCPGRATTVSWRPGLLLTGTSVPQLLFRLDEYYQGYLRRLAAPSPDTKDISTYCGPKISVIVRSWPRTTGASNQGGRQSSQSHGWAAKSGIAPRSPPDPDPPGRPMADTQPRPFRPRGNAWLGGRQRQLHLFTCCYWLFMGRNIPRIADWVMVIAILIKIKTQYTRTYLYGPTRSTAGLGGVGFVRVGA